MSRAEEPSPGSKAASHHADSHRTRATGSRRRGHDDLSESPPPESPNSRIKPAPEAPIESGSVGSSMSTVRVAPVEPMDTNGVLTMTVGTALWFAATIGLFPFWETLRDNGTEWWLWTTVAGFGLGLIGVEYCRRRRNTPPADVSAPAPGGGRRRR